MVYYRDRPFDFFVTKCKLHIFEDFKELLQYLSIFLIMTKHVLP